MIFKVIQYHLLLLGNPSLISAIFSLLVWIVQIKSGSTDEGWLYCENDVTVIFYNDLTKHELELWNINSKIFQVKHNEFNKGIVGKYNFQYYDFSL